MLIITLPCSAPPGKKAGPTTLNIKEIPTTNTTTNDSETDENDMDDLVDELADELADEDEEDDDKKSDDSSDDESDDPKYEGAIVLPPKTGIYTDDPVAVFDYNSLYPSSMISENISHDTIVTVRDYNLEG